MLGKTNRGFESHPVRPFLGQGIHSAGRENWLGLRVTGDQSLPVRFLLRTGVFTHAKDAKAGTGDEGIRDSGVKGGPISPCAVTAKDANPTTFRSRGTSKGWEVREYHLPDAESGWFSTSPNKLDGFCDPWVQAVVNGTAQCGRFQ